MKRVILASARAGGDKHAWTHRPTPQGRLTALLRRLYIRATLGSATLRARAGAQRHGAE